MTDSPTQGIKTVLHPVTDLAAAKPVYAALLGVPPQNDESYYVGFEVGCSSLGTFSTRFTELVGVPPSVYRREAAQATAGMPPCVAKQVTRPIRNREAPAPEPPLY